MDGYVKIFKYQNIKLNSSHIDDGKLFGKQRTIFNKIEDFEKKNMKLIYIYIYVYIYIYIYIKQLKKYWRKILNFED